MSCTVEQTSISDVLFAERESPGSEGGESCLLLLCKEMRNSSCSHWLPHAWHKACPDAGSYDTSVEEFSAVGGYLDPKAAGGKGYKRSEDSLMHNRVGYHHHCAWRAPEVLPAPARPPVPALWCLAFPRFQQTEMKAGLVSFAWAPVLGNLMCQLGWA